MTGLIIAAVGLVLLGLSVLSLRDAVRSGRRDPARQLERYMRLKLRRLRLEGWADGLAGWPARPDRRITASVVPLDDRAERLRIRGIMRAEYAAAHRQGYAAREDAKRRQRIERRMRRLINARRKED